MFRIFFIVLRCSCSTKYQSHLPRLLRLYQITRSNKNPYWRLENPCNVFLCWQKLFNFTLDFYKSRTCVIMPDPLPSQLKIQLFVDDILVLNVDGIQSYVYLAFCLKNAQLLKLAMFNIWKDGKPKSILERIKSVFFLILWRKGKGFNTTEPSRIIDWSSYVTLTLLFSSRSSRNLHNINITL